MPAVFSHYVGAFFCLALSSGFVLADSDFDAGVDLQYERAHQEFGSDSANVNTIDVAPFLQYGNWSFSVDVPWISADANYVNSNFPSRLVAACSDPAATAAKHPRLAALLGSNLTTAIENYCQRQGVLAPGDTVSGLSDITAFVHYGMLLDDRGIWLLSVGTGYKFDNGDVDQNLGSGTRNTMLEASLGANYGKFNGVLTTGYAFVDGGSEFVTESHYSYATLDLGLSPVDWLTVGCAFDYQQSYMALADDLTEVTGYLKFKPWQHLRMKVYARDFGNAEGYPDREYGGSLSFVY